MMMQRRLGTTIAGAFAAVALMAMPAAAGAANLTSGFDAGDEGWRVFANSVNLSITQSPEWVAGGGNPGGNIRVTDASQEYYWDVQAPPAWRGDRSLNYGGSVSFDIRHAAPDHGPLVTLTSYDQGFLFHTFSAIPNGWKTYSAPLSETDPCWGFIPPAPGSEPRTPTHAEFLAVLGELDQLGIGGELGFASGDTGEIDNVALSETSSSASVGCGPPAGPPDSDGDNTPDATDACPGQPGIPPFAGCPPPNSGPPAIPPAANPACVTATEKLAKAKDKLKDAESKRAKAKAREKVKKAKKRAKEACG